MEVAGLCEYCGTFLNDDKSVLHKHIPSTPVLCEFCGDVFDSQCQVELHYASKHSREKILTSLDHGSNLPNMTRGTSQSINRGSDSPNMKQGACRFGKPIILNGNQHTTRVRPLFLEARTNACFKPAHITGTESSLEEVNHSCLYIDVAKDDVYSEPATLETDKPPQNKKARLLYQSTQTQDESTENSDIKPSVSELNNCLQNSVVSLESVQTSDLTACEDIKPSVHELNRSLHKSILHDGSSASSLNKSLKKNPLTSLCPEPCHTGVQRNLTQHHRTGVQNILTEPCHTGGQDNLVENIKVNKPSKLKQNLQTSQKDNLVDKKPSVCWLCKQVFFSPVELSAHFEQVHCAHLSYKCERCSCYFRTSHDVDEHFKLVHTYRPPQESAVLSGHNTEKKNAIEETKLARKTVSSSQEIGEIVKNSEQSADGEGNFESCKSIVKSDSLSSYQTVFSQTNVDGAVSTLSQAFSSQQETNSSVTTATGVVQPQQEIDGTVISNAVLGIGGAVAVSKTPKGGKMSTQILQNLTASQRKILPKPQPVPEEASLLLPNDPAKKFGFNPKGEHAITNNSCYKKTEHGPTASSSSNSFVDSNEEDSSEVIYRCIAVCYMCIGGRNVCFRCSFCEDEFLTCHEVIQHQNDKHRFHIFGGRNKNTVGITSDGVHVFVCNACRKVFSNVEGITFHDINKHLKIVRFQCKALKDKFTKKEDFYKHYKISVLKMCGIAKSGNILLGKNNLSPSDIPFCPICGMKVQNFMDFKNHVQSVHCFGNLFDCWICGDLFFSELHKDKHMSKFHENSISCICKKCDMQFFSCEEIYAHHMDVHNREVCICCTCECTVKFSHIRQHYQIDHNITELHECTMCKVVYPDVKYLKGHYSTTHYMFDCYKCNICHATLADFKHYQLHFRMNHLGNFQNSLNIVGNLIYVFSQFEDPEETSVDSK